MGTSLFARLEVIKIGKFRDLTGETFGRWKVLGRGKNRGKHIYWICECSCENHTIKEISGSSLTRNLSVSCGCIKKENPNRFIDLTGKKYGELEVIRRVENKGSQVVYECKCSCGRITNVFASHLRSGHTKTCGNNIHFKGMGLIDLTGKTFNYLTALSPKSKECGGRFRTYWVCRCENCGNIHEVEQSHLVGGVISCGCIDIAKSGSQSENEIKTFILDAFPKLKIEKSRILDGKEIDIYIPELKIGIEYNGSAYHASENNIYNNKNRYYHRDKFLLAKSKGIHLITVFDKDYEENKWQILERIRHIISGNNKFFIPYSVIEYTDNDYDTGEWLVDFGYKEIGQEEPCSFEHNGFVVFRCGRTIWTR